MDKQTYNQVVKKINKEKKESYKKLTDNEKLLKKMRFIKELLSY